MSSESDTQYPISNLSPATSDPDSIASLPDSASSDDIDDDEEVDESDAEKEWKESLEQLELLLTMVVVPYVGKYFGRKCAYWGEWNHGAIALCAREKEFWLIKPQVGRDLWNGNTR